MPKRRTASLSIARTLKATPEKVFEAWTQPEALKRWFGPGDAMAVRVEMDVRVGGRYRVVLRAASGEEHRVAGIYREVVAGRKLVFTWAWESTPQRESLVTVEIAPTAGGASLLLTHERFFDEAARERHQQGWTASLQRLQHALAGLAKSGKDQP
jgi:uncharacterized protein YndB with AHSA1/START domain